MGDPALDIKNDPLAIEGFEEVFDSVPVTEFEITDAEQVTRAEEPVTSASLAVPTGAQGIPVEEAAQIIGTSVNALKKRLRKGTLRGTKIESKHGEKWFVDLAELPAHLAPVTESKATDAEQVTHAEARVTGASQVVPTGADGISGLELINRIQELERKLEGATYRNGYLEAENDGLRALLGAKDSHIRLLTDSQHKRGPWSQFWSWFIGR